MGAHTLRARPQLYHEHHALPLGDWQDVVVLVGEEQGGVSLLEGVELACAVDLGSHQIATLEVVLWISEHDIHGDDGPGVVVLGLSELSPRPVLVELDRAEVQGQRVERRDKVPVSLIHLRERLP
eukprot:CAMPEP_0170181596 /NCGR_PEP_ID=MMETSP0040_2-20121228/25530_1 /TAXON_ID=641309 /ORGANISM="Lotharella oceanica, Strain CCMP622" /LENGTH=124 /DNA_ID=CAMNT_0010426705 /DNA_START=271 /DNA_END=645 /DNA_ORIENTATION=-